MTETTTEQLAEIEGQAADTPATEYTPPEGWRLLAVGELVMLDDQWVRQDGSVWRSMGTEGPVSEGSRYIRRIEPEPQPEPQQYTPPEGWRVLAVGEELREGDVIVHADDAMYATARAGKVVQANQRYIRPIEPQPQSELQQADTPATEYTPPEGWRVLQAGERLRFGDMAVKNDGSCCSTERVGGWVGSYQRYIRPIEPQPQPQQREPEEQPQEHEQPPMLQDAEQKIRLLRECYTRQAELIADLKYERAGALERGEVLSREKRKLTEQIEELRSEVSYVQRLLGESRQRVTQLEELVASLRNINDATEKAVISAGRENTDLQHRLDVVSAEWAEQAETSRRLRIELDAVQQVPADSPELRQLRADLAEVTRERDQYLDSYQRIFGDLETIRETTKAAAVEAISEWVEPIRLVDNPNLANETLQHLPQIMRHLTGLAQD